MKNYYGFVAMMIMMNDHDDDDDSDDAAAADDDDDDDDHDVLRFITRFVFYIQEEEKNVQLYGFENDSPELEADQLEGIHATPVESFSPAKHCNLMDFLR